VTKRVALAVGALSVSGLLSLGSTAQASVTTHDAASAWTVATGQAQASGAFTAVVDFPSLDTRQVGKAKCEFRVEGTLTFTGTLDGEAMGTTRALIDAPCSEALSRAPGTFRDVFRFEGDFVGTVAGVHVEGGLSYAGVTRPGGSIAANIRLRAEGVKAALRTDDAELGRGGTYRGVVVTKG
jgi:hypothetical protein